jgi:hypothetical protein
MKTQNKEFGGGILCAKRMMGGEKAKMMRRSSILPKVYRVTT